MKNQEIRSMSADELQERIATEKEGLQKLKFAHEISPVENPMKIRHARRLIAKMETELRAKVINS